ncbi:MAG TPA: AAA family ATPase [Caulobacteraceae bacterium]|nr:AAA family ATPase [Caulobacteraceae bacterium]
MHVRRLRLSGFKSFVDPVDFIVEPGLTGVIGPNGCGKSNLLEALRWVMGAASAKAMRGEGMDDVIFAGATGRPARNHAEVTLTLDNPEGEGPAAFAADPVLEISRRIDRGEGSTYRINGSEVRARDVQLLFADASTGANSPALVRQGQISELIAAKPQNRRRILEEAAGVSGLHGRRHEAQLRVRAAQANLERLDDLSREVESQLGRLKREARAAARYKGLAAEVRTLQAVLMHARWAEAAAAAARALQEARAADVEALGRAGAAASAAAALIAADEALPALRDEAAAAAAILGRLTLEADRAERDLAAARAEADRLAADLSRIAADEEREQRIGADAARALTGLAEDLDRLKAEIAASPERLPELEAAAAAAESARAAADANLEALAAQAAARAAESNAAAEREDDARSRLSRTDRALAQAAADRASLPPSRTGELGAARDAVTAAQAAEARARKALEGAEGARGDAARKEADARTAARRADDELARARAAARGLADAVAATVRDAAYPPALAAISTDAGLEAALAAGLGDDLDAALDAEAPAAWLGADASPPDWPPGVQPLAAFVRAPPALSARLAWIGLADGVDAERLAALLPVGARLVTRDGGLWRWDGLRIRSEAPRPAQVRLEQKTRLSTLEATAAGLEGPAGEARAAHAAAVQAVTEADAAVRTARAGPPATAAAAGQAREALARIEREAASLEVRERMLDETIVRFEAEKAEAAQAHAEAAARLAALPPLAAGPSDALRAARVQAGATREAAFAARSAAEREAAARAGRARRCEGLEREHAQWIARAKQASEREARLDRDRNDCLAALAKAREAPAALDTRRLEVADQLDRARGRQIAAADTLAAGEAARTAAERAQRQADGAAADAREVRAGAHARREAAEARAGELAAAARDATGEEPEALGLRLSAEAVAAPEKADAIEAHLAALERDLAALGPVNLLAEQELAELEGRMHSLAGERDDLAAALARLNEAIEALNAEGRERLLAAFEVIHSHFRDLFTTLFGGGQAELRLVESDDPLESGLEILACPPGKRLTTMSLMSGGEQALTAVALIFAVFLANPAPICVLDEVDAPLDDANVERFCDLLEAMRRRASTRFLTITHNPLTMSRMDRLFGVTMRERGVSQLVSVDLRQAEALVGV